MNARDLKMFADFAMMNMTLILAMMISTITSGTEFNIVNGVLLGTAMILDCVFMVLVYKRSVQRKG